MAYHLDELMIWGCPWFQLLLFEGLPGLVESRVDSHRGFWFKKVWSSGTLYTLELVRISLGRMAEDMQDDKENIHSQGLL